MNRIYLFGLLLFFQLNAFSQQQFFAFDTVPGLIQSYKPAYEQSFPDWAKMLYQNQLNVQELDWAYSEFMASHPEAKSPIVRYYKLWRRAVDPYVNSDGSLALPDYSQVQTDYFKQQSNSKSNKTDDHSASNWTFLGPKETFWLNESGSPTTPLSCPWQVNVYSFDVAASNPQILYCGTETGFVNKTTNKGMDWQQLAPDYMFGGGVTAVAVHPTNADIVYVAAGNQVHKTTNGGQDWAPLLTIGNQFQADRLRIDPNNTEKIIASASNGLFITTDAGQNWVQKWTSPVYDAEIKPNDGNMIIGLSKAMGKFAVIVSTDGGSSFQIQPTFPTNVVESSGGLLAVTPANPNILLAIMLSSNNTPYLVKGVYGAGNWSWSLLATGQTTAFPMDNGQGYFDLVLDISPVNENSILVGTTTLFKSVNAGTSFSAVGGYYGGFSIHPDIQDIKMLSNGDTWVATDGGMNLTTDNFVLQSNYFVRINGLIGSDMWGFDQGWNEDLVVGGRYHNGNTALADFYEPKALRMGGAESPTGWVLQGKSRHVAFNDLGNGWVLPTSATAEPEGRFIFSKYPNMEEYGGRRGNMVFHPNYYGTVYLGEGNGFWKSMDMGVSWDLLHDFGSQVRYLQISYSNPNILYADVVNKGLCKSEDGGLTWVQKPSLTSPPNGTAYWKGKLFIAVSPYDANVVYACLMNGTWSADVGKVFKSVDGGDTWENYTGTVSEYLKCMVVQPTSEQKDLVYLFTNGTNGNDAQVFYRKEGMDDWLPYANGYPSGMTVNMALPFYRDGKLRVGGNCSVWESPMTEPEFTPIINPWVEKQHYNCMTDTLYFDDHSIMNHAGVSWQWQIDPEPAYISNAAIRNPKVVLGAPGSYNVTLTVNKNGQVYSKSIPAMVTTTTCPSIEDCSNPAQLPKSQWELLFVDSQEVNYPGLATMSFDADPETIWHTRWSTGSDPYPHEIQIDLGETYRIYQFTYLTRQDGENGRIKAYELYISEDPQAWGDPVATGQWENTSAPQTIELGSGVVGKYFRLLALSEVNGNAWASAAEFSMVGCTDLTYGLTYASNPQSITAYPLPTHGMLTISLPAAGSFNYQVFDATGRRLQAGQTLSNHNGCQIDLNALKPGVYALVLVKDKVTYRLRVVKE